MSASRSLLLLCCLPLACAKPSPKLEGSTGTELAQEGEERRLQGPLTPAEAPDPDSCPATKLREVRYGSTVSQQVELPADIAKLRCVEDPRAQLEAEQACAQAYNEASWTHALYQRELELVELQQLQLWNSPDAAHGAEPGQVLPHPEHNDTSLVYLGTWGSDCGGHSALTSVSPGISVARDPRGQLHVVLPMPELETREYAACSCNPGCGAYQEPMPNFLELPKRAKLGERVELSYPAIALGFHDVESTSCCCAP